MSGARGFRVEGIPCPQCGERGKLWVDLQRRETGPDKFVDYEAYWSCECGWGGTENPVEVVRSSTEEVRAEELRKRSS